MNEWINKQWIENIINFYLLAWEKRIYHLAVQKLSQSPFLYVGYGSHTFIHGIWLQCTIDLFACFYANHMPFGAHLNDLHFVKSTESSEYFKNQYVWFIHAQKPNSLLQIRMCKQYISPADTTRSKRITFVEMKKGNWAQRERITMT